LGYLQAEIRTQDVNIQQAEIRNYDVNMKQKYFPLDHSVHLKRISTGTILTKMEAQ
jgi:hypothetical protein